MSTLALATSPSPTKPVATAPDCAPFVELLAAHDRQLRALALRILGDPGLVDDALQEAYLRAFRALPRFRGESSLATWLHRIVHNVCIDEHRRRRRRAEVPFDEGSHEGEPADAADLGVERSDLSAGLAGLPYEQRATIVLVDGYGLNYAAVADMLGVPVGTVGSRAFRARIVLRQALDAA
ncbi:MAG: RNA polymerase sigma factor [Acidimicrobiales bacterium]